MFYLSISGILKKQGIVNNINNTSFKEAKYFLLTHFAFSSGIVTCPCITLISGSLCVSVCRQVKDGVAAIFGPMSMYSAVHVQSVCDSLGIPHVETRWDLSPVEDVYSINLFPHYQDLSLAFVDFALFMKWTDFTILYETNEGK